MLEVKGTTEDEMVGWHHRLDGHEFEQTLGAVDEHLCCFHVLKVASFSDSREKIGDRLCEVRVSSVQFSRSVVSDSLQPHEPQHARPPCPSPTPGVHQTHVHCVGDAIQPSHPLSSPSPPILKPSQHEGLFNRVSSSHQVAKVLEFQLQHQSSQ